MRSLSCWTAAVTSSLLLVACSGSDTPTTLTLAPTTVESSTAPPAAISTTSAVVTSVAESSPESVDPSTTTSTSTVAPTTTLDPSILLEQLLQDSLDRSEAALIEALASPGDPASKVLLAGGYTGESLQLFSEFLDHQARDGLVGQDNPSRPTSATLLEIVEAPEGLDGLVAEAIVCRVDTLVLGFPSPDGGGVGEVVDDAVGESTLRKRFERQDGIWKVSSSIAVERAAGESMCDF